jgi:hypothetical protein
MPNDKEQLVKDGGGLFVRIRPITDGGAVSFRLAYRIGGKLRWAVTDLQNRKDGGKEIRLMFEKAIRR